MPDSKRQRKSKLQKTEKRKRAIDAVLSRSEFFGVWVLAFGVSATRRGYTDNGEKRSLIRPLLSANESMRTPALSRSVRCKFASGTGAS